MAAHDGIDMRQSLLSDHDDQQPLSSTHPSYQSNNQQTNQTNQNNNNTLTTDHNSQQQTHLNSNQNTQSANTSHQLDYQQQQQQPEQYHQQQQYHQQLQQQQDYYQHQQQQQQQQYYPARPVPSHVLYQYNAVLLPPYPYYPTFCDKWHALSRLSQFFLLLIPTLWLASFAIPSTRLVSAFLPLLALPSLFMYRSYLNNYQHVEINLFLNSYMIGFTVAAIAVLLIELVVTTLAAVICIYDQLSTILAAIENGSTDDISTTDDILPGAEHTVGFYFFVFCLSYFSAGCVEESMKYYLINRIQRKTPGFRDKQGYLLYALVAALGFSTVENIGYAFAVTSPVDQILINILTRILISTPIHLSTAYLIGIGIVKRQVYLQSISTFRILIWPIILHGSFDFGLIIAATTINENDLFLLGMDTLIILFITGMIIIIIHIEKKSMDALEIPSILPLYEQTTTYGSGDYRQIAVQPFSPLSQQHQQQQQQPPPSDYQSGQIQIEVAPTHQQ